VATPKGKPIFTKLLWTDTAKNMSAYKKEPSVSGYIVEEIHDPVILILLLSKKRKKEKEGG
jgi:hypothetical protein